MSQTQRADTQTLPKVGSTRRCPNCDAPSVAMKRWPQATGIWQVTCSRCDHVWQERTARSFRDTLRESPPKVLVSLACLLVVIAISLFVFAYPIGKLLELGRPGAVALSVLLVVAFVVTVAAAYAWRHSIQTGPTDVE